MITQDKRKIKERWRKRCRTSPYTKINPQFPKLNSLKVKKRIFILSILIFAALALAILTGPNRILLKPQFIS